MTLSIDDLIKLLLAFSLCFAIIGISWQLIRMLGELLTTVRESNYILKAGRELTEKFVEDYDYILEQIKFIIDSISMLIRAVVIPITNIFGFLKGIENIPFFKNRKSKQSGQEE